MAGITRDGDSVVVRLSTAEKVFGLHGNLRVPLSCVREVAIRPEPLGAVRGLRAPGLGVPGRVKIGTWRRRHGKAFVVARRDVPAVELRLDGAPFDQVLVSTPDAERVAGELQARLAA